MPRTFNVGRPCSSSSRDIERYSKNELTLIAKSWDIPVSVNDTVDSLCRRIIQAYYSRVENDDAVVEYYEDGNTLLSNNKTYEKWKEKAIEESNSTGFADESLRNVLLTPEGMPFLNASDVFLTRARYKKIKENNRITNFLSNNDILETIDDPSKRSADDLIRLYVFSKLFDKNDDRLNQMALLIEELPQFPEIRRLDDYIENFKNYV